MRAKVSRVKNDLRTLATAVESFMVVNNTYPEDSYGQMGQNNGFTHLTTPIAFIASLLTDPFFIPEYRYPNPRDGRTYFYTGNDKKYYEMGSGADNGKYLKAQADVLISVAPNLGDDTHNEAAFPFLTYVIPYDPTHGTRSSGDINRFGGDYQAGDWTIVGIDLRHWNVTPSYPE